MNKLLVSVILLMPCLCYAGSPVVGVVYPELRAPYKQVFDSIIEGIEEQPGMVVKRYQASSYMNTTTLRSRMQEDQVKGLIALGRSGVKLASKVSGGLPVVAGAIVIKPAVNNNFMAGISLAPDPNMVFSRLMDLAPEVKRVHVVYNPKRNSWLIGIAEQAAEKLGITMLGYQAGNISRSIKHYKGILAKSDGVNDAIWLLQDPTIVNEKVVVPFVLKEAWGRLVVVFSGQPIHVKKGALFALYPNHFKLGKRLASTVKQVLNTALSKPEKASLLSSLKIAVNRRTVSHLGLRNASQSGGGYDLIFPAP